MILCWNGFRFQRNFCVYSYPASSHYSIHSYGTLVMPSELVLNIKICHVCHFLKKMYLKGRATGKGKEKSGRDKERERAIPSTESLLKQTQQPDLGLAEVEDTCLELCLPHGWQGYQCLRHLPLLPEMYQQETGLGAEQLELQPTLQYGMLTFRWRINPQCHKACLSILATCSVCGSVAVSTSIFRKFMKNAG